MNVLSISLLGKFEVRYGSHSLVGLDRGKVQELLCYLLLYRDRPHARERLADLLWAEKPPDQARQNLRKALWQLQSSLEEQIGSEQGRLVLAEPDWVQLNPDADLWLDVAAFEQASGLTSGIPGRDLSLEQVRALRCAVALYRGDLLEGLYQDWCLYERERLRYLYLAMLDKLMAYCEAQHDWEQALTYGVLILRLDHAHERTHRRMMRLHWQRADRTLALRQYDRCVSALAAELNVPPSQRTRDLVQRIRADDRVDPVLAPQPQNGGDLIAVASFAKRLEQFKTHLSALAHTAHQLEEEIKALELTSKGR